LKTLLQDEERRRSAARAVLWTAAWTGFSAAVGLTAYGIVTQHRDDRMFMLGIGGIVVSSFAIIALWVTRAITPVDVAYSMGYEAGLAEGERLGRRVAKPVVVHLPEHDDLADDR
jgi:hypothetical protein